MYYVHHLKKINFTIYDFSIGIIIICYQSIKQYKQFNPIWNAIRNLDRQMLMEPESRAEIWKGYFEKLLNRRMPA